MTYFLIHQVEVIRRAIHSLHEYIDHKTKETEESQYLLRAQSQLNHRQAALLSHAMRHPGKVYTVDGHKNSHNTAYDTARRDLLSLAEVGLLLKSKRGRAMVFSASPDLMSMLKRPFLTCLYGWRLIWRQSLHFHCFHTMKVLTSRPIIPQSSAKKVPAVA